MNEALCSILTGGEEWCFHTEGRSIKFNKDGTGELWCRCNFCCWIAVELEWKSIGIKPSHDPSPLATSVAQDRGPQLLGQLDLQITLTKRLPKWVNASLVPKNTVLNEFSLAEDAFRPKLYTVRIEKGNFIEPLFIGCPSTNSSRFALRLIFDKSPYPPQSEWKNPGAGPIGNRFWDHIEFVSRETPGLAKKGKPMNNVSEGGWCIVS